MFLNIWFVHLTLYLALFISSKQPEFVCQRLVNLVSQLCIPLCCIYASQINVFYLSTLSSCLEEHETLVSMRGSGVMSTQRGLSLCVLEFGQCKSRKIKNKKCTTHFLPICE